MTTGQNPEALMRVLLVEDDAQTAASIKMLLINENFICDTTDLGVRRDKAALSSGCKAHPAIRSSRKQSEQSWRQRNG